MKYLITIKIFDGENVYYDYFTLDYKYKRDVDIEVDKIIKEAQEFTREQVLESIKKITKKEFEVLQKFGVV